MADIYAVGLAHTQSNVRIKDVKVRFVGTQKPVAEFSYSEGYQLAGPSPNIWVQRNAEGWSVRYSNDGVYYTFDASSSFDPDRPESPNRGIASYAWGILGKSSHQVITWGPDESNSRKIHCIFPIDDVYQVTLTVKDIDGNESTIIKEIKILLPGSYITEGADGDNITWERIELWDKVILIPINMGGGWPTVTILYKDPETGLFLPWVHPAEYTSYPPKDKTYYVANPNDKSKSIEQIPAQTWINNPWPGWKIVGSYDAFDPVTFQMTNPTGFAQVIQGYMNAKLNYARARFGEGSVSQSETKTHSVPIDSSVKNSTLGLSWKGSSMNLVLRKPGGGWVTAETIAGDPQIAYMEGPAYKAFLLLNPAPGNWTAYVSGLEVPAAGENYQLNALIDGDLKLLVTTDQEYYALGKAVTISATLMNGATLLPGATVCVDVKRPDGEVERLDLFDDATHGDRQSGDGIYTNFFTQTKISGYYLLSANVSGSLGGEAYQRSAFRTVWIKAPISFLPLLLD